MAKRDLDNEFKEQLKGQGPFQFSEENWKAASAMLDKELPVTKRGWFFNRTTIVLSIAVLFLSSLTFILTISNNPIEPYKTEYSPSILNNSNNSEGLISNSTSSSPTSIPFHSDEVEAKTKSDSQTSSTSTSGINETTSIKEDVVAVRAIENKAETQMVKSSSKPNTVKIQNSNSNRTTKEFTNPKAASAIAASNNLKTSQTPERSNTSFEQSPYSLEDNSKSAEDEFQNESEAEMSATAVESTGKTEDETGGSDTAPKVELETASDNSQEQSSNDNTVAQETAAFEHNDGRQSQIGKNNSNQNQSYFKAGFETGVFSATRNLKALDADCEDYVLKRNSEESMKPSYYFGLNFGQQINKFNWQVGLNYSVYQENIAYNNEVLGLDFLDNGYWNQFNSIDTSVSSKWVIDSIFVGHWEFDTTFTNSIDSNYVEQWDTTVAVKLDSTIELNNGVHNLSYFEVPLFVGYTFGKDKWLFDVQSGVSVGFLSGSRGSRYIDKSLGGLVEQSTALEQFNKVIWKAHFRVGVRYSLNNWDIGLYPHYSYTLNNVLNSDKVDQRYGNLGISLGVYYKF